MFEDKDETILARWLAGELTNEERVAFEKDDAFQDYQQIVAGLERFKKPDIDKEAMRSKLTAARTAPKKGKLIILKPILYAASLAASVVLIVGLFFNEVTYSTGKGEQLAVVLDDGSKVQLNADSELTRKRFFWKNDKSVTLNGEAFFDISKGDGFNVNTPNGTIAVLGTEFNIRTRDTSFELVCYEGKVQFESTSNEKAILTEGDAITLDGDKILKDKRESNKPSWLQGTSTFSNQLFLEVVTELERQYNIEIKNKELLDNQRFTGSFVHNNLDIALKTVFTPMGITYTLSSDKKIVVVNPL